MSKEDDVVESIKESRKRHLRILDAALKETVVDTQVILGICIQISRQAFYNELQDYSTVASDYMSSNHGQYSAQDISLMQQVRQRLSKMKSLLKVQLQHNKKLDKMFWLLLEQNQEVKTNIQNYKEVYEKAQ